MQYISHVPSPPLNAYIDDLYYVEGAAPYPHLRILPMPSLHLIINLGTGFHVHDPEHPETLALCGESWSVGLWERSYVMHYPPQMRFYGVHFKPGGAYPFLRLPLSELLNQIAPLDAILGRYAAEIRERLYGAPTIHDGLLLLEKLLLARLAPDSQGVDIVQYASTEIARARGVLSIRALSKHIGISQNHLGTQFKRVTGVPPKQLARFYRFASVLRSVDPLQPVDWTRIAHEAQYYDQPHFNHDFAAFIGSTPTDYLRLRARFHAENPEQARNLGQLPTD